MESKGNYAKLRQLKDDLDAKLKAENPERWDEEGLELMEKARTLVQAMTGLSESELKKQYASYHILCSSTAELDDFPAEDTPDSIILKTSERVFRATLRKGSDRG